MNKTRFEIRRAVEFTNEGQKLFGILHLPIQKAPAPCVLFCHGLAGHKVGKHRMYVALSECLSKSGIGSLRFDFRGSGDSEGEFDEMSLEGEVSDAVAALQFLSAQPEVSEEHLALFGRSFGGAVSIIAASRFKKIQGLALWAPVFNASHWEQQWELVRTHQIDEHARRELMRIDGQLPSLEFYKELFAMSLENALLSLSRVPLLHIHGEKDPLVGIEHADQFERVRQGAKASSKFIRLPHSDHDFSHPEEKKNAIAMTCEWLVRLFHQENA